MICRYCGRSVDSVLIDGCCSRRCWIYYHFLYRGNSDLEVK